MNLPVLVISLYGLLSLVGGIIGYVKAKSRPSLIAGSVSGLVLIGCAYDLMNGNRMAALLAGLVAISLGGRFFIVWRQKRRIMPDLVMIVGAVITLAAASLALLAR